jgi:uncharacterized protein GlcG (DUF336 family)
MGAAIAALSPATAFIGRPEFSRRYTTMPRQISTLGLTDGGMLVRAGETVIGAVGASGGTVEQDQEVVEAAVAGFAAQR